MYLVVHQERAIAVFQGGVRVKDGVVGLHDSRGDLGGRVDGETQLGLLAKVHRESLHEQRGEAGPSASAERVEDKEPLQTGALVGHLPDLGDLHYFRKSIKWCHLYYFRKSIKWCYLCLLYTSDAADE